MAVSVNGTLVLNENVEGDASPYTSASFSIADNALVSFAFWTSDDIDQGDITPTDTFTNLGAWTLVLSRLEGTVDRLQVWQAQMSGTGGTGTISMATTGTVVRIIAHVVEVTGQDTTTPNAQSTSGGGTATTLTLTLGSAPAAGSATVGHTGGRLTGATPITGGTGETTIAESATSTSTNRARMLTQYSTDQEHNWGNLPTTANNGVLWEIAQASGLGADIIAVIISQTLVRQHKQPIHMQGY